jgi:nitrate reductase gamma subunit
MIVGFVLEAMRISMAGSPQGAAYAFVGFGLSRFFAGVELTASYGTVWYLHAFLTAGFVAYLPFSRMFHLLMAPLSLALGAASRHPEESQS